MRSTPSHPLLLSLAVLLLSVPHLASANGGGLLRPALPVEGCSSCHTGGTVPNVQLIVDEGDGVARGETVPVRIRVQAVNGNRAGFNVLVADGLLGKLGDETRVAGATDTNPGREMTHAGPSYTGADPGIVEFIVNWTAPATEGTTVDFEVLGVSNNGGQTGAMGRVTQTVTVRCPRYWPDSDGDGYGTGDFTETCDQAPPGTATRGGDCNDADPAVNPGANEACNGLDDNCNGESDEVDLGAPAMCTSPDICMHGSCQPPPTLDGGTDAGNDGGTTPDAGSDAGVTPDGGGTTGGGDAHISIAYAGCSAAGIGALPLALLAFAALGLRRRKER